MTNKEDSISGGTLANLPADVEALLRANNAERTPVDWSLRFGASLDGVLVALSGMSTLEQVDQNTANMQGVPSTR